MSSEQRSATPKPGGRLDDVEQAQALEEPLHGSIVPRKLGRYVVLDELGRGGMGTVLRAHDRELDRQVALKMLHRDLDEQHTVRLRREAQAMAKLSHPNVVQVYEVGQAEGQTFVVMELVKGQTLAEWMRREPRPDWRTCVELFIQLGAGLAAAHERGLVHRDFKPGNAIIDDKGRARVLDFGLARQVDALDDELEREHTVEMEPAPLEESLTRTGAVLGTPGYMPLEQMRGAEVDARSDQYSFCVALYEAVYGERPYEGNSVVAVRVSMSNGAIRPAPKGSKVPGALRMILLEGLALDPEQRWPSMEALLAELQRLVAPRRRRWVVLGMMIGPLAIGAGLGMEMYMEWSNRCAGARAQLDGIWDDARRQEVEAAMLGTGLSYASDTWDRVERQLDEYATAWVDERTEVCKATRSTGEQSEEVMDLRMECLWGHQVALRETVRVLAEADATRVNQAVSLVAELPKLSRCDDVDALRADLPPPEDPEVAQRVQAQRERIQHAKALDGAGDYAEALEVAKQAVQSSGTLGYPPLMAEALLQRGIARSRENQPVDAERDLEEALGIAIEHGHDAVAARAVAHLIYVVGNRQGRIEHGLWWGKLALLLAKSPGIEPEVEAQALHKIGLVLHHQRKLGQALTYYQRAATIREQASGRDHPDVAMSLNNAGVVLTQQGKLPEALALHRRALAIWEGALGPEHPSVVGSLANIGEVLRQQGELSEALTHFQRTLTVANINASSSFLWRGDLREIENGIGLTLQEQGKHMEALAHFQRALAIMEEGSGPRWGFAVVEQLNIGLVLVEQGKPDEAAMYLDRVLAFYEEKFGSEHPLVADPLVGLAEAALTQHDLDSARAHAERAVSIRESGEVAPAQLADARFVLARALWDDQTQRARAHTLAVRARDAFAEHGKGREGDLAEVEAWLAEHHVP